MISEALKFTEELLEHELNLVFGRKPEGHVVASSLIHPDGSMVEDIKNKLVVSVINLEHETTRKYLGNYVSDGKQNFGKVAPPAQFNLYMLISANFDSSKKYLEANKVISTVISVFQSQPVFTKNSKIKMDAPLEKLTFEVYNVPMSELSHIWSGIGAKYLPSIIYKVRMLAIQEEKAQKEVPGITGLGDKLTSNS